MKRTRDGRIRLHWCSRRCRTAIFALAAVLAVASTARSQEDPARQKQVSQASELGRDNLSRVAASAADIKTVLVKDAGLMVEVKRWVARDATAQGQIISETDLTDDAIFDRLQSDVQFRSIATQIVQRYGYLIPQLNPDSAAGKEQEILIRERAKLIAQKEGEEEQERSRLRRARASQSGFNCNALDPSCTDRQESNYDQNPRQQKDQDFDQDNQPSRRPEDVSPQSPA